MRQVEVNFAAPRAFASHLARCSMPPLTPPPTSATLLCLQARHGSGPNQDIRHSGCTIKTAPTRRGVQAAPRGVGRTVSTLQLKLHLDSPAQRPSTPARRGVRHPSGVRRSSSAPWPLTSEPMRSCSGPSYDMQTCWRRSRKPWPAQTLHTCRA